MRDTGSISGFPGIHVEKTAEGASVYMRDKPEDEQRKKELARYRKIEAVLRALICSLRDSEFGMFELEPDPGIIRHAEEALKPA